MYTLKGKQMPTIKDAVDQYLGDNNMTKEVLAEELGMGRSALFNKLRGSNEFSLPEAYKLSRMLGCTLDDLYEMTAA